MQLIEKSSDLLQLRAHASEVKPDSLPCWQLLKFCWRLQVAHVIGQQPLDIIVGGCVPLPQLCFPESVAFGPARTEVGMHHMKWGTRSLQIRMPSVTMVKHNTECLKCANRQS